MEAGIIANAQAAVALVGNTSTGVQKPQESSSINIAKALADEASDPNQETSVKVNAAPPPDDSDDRGSHSDTEQGVGDQVDLSV